MLDIARFAHFMRRDANDDAVWFAVESAELLVAVEAGPALADPPQPAVEAAVFAIALRLLAAPPGVASESEGSTSFGYKPDAGTLALTENERVMIRKALGRTGLGEIATVSDGYGSRRFDPAGGR